MLTKKEVMISIHTVRRGVHVPLFAADGAEIPLDEEYDDIDPEDVEDPEEPVSDPDDPDAPEESEMMMEGRLVCTYRRAELIYDESELTGMEGSVTKIGFDLDFPELISMLRSGPVNTSLVFEPHRRHLCVYNTPFSAFEVCVHTLEVRNFLFTDGTLYLDYLIEIHGARAERCKMTVRVR